MELNDAQTLAWRLSRHSLVPRAETHIAEVVDRVVALRGWPERLAAGSIDARLRLPSSAADGGTASAAEQLAAAVTTGAVIRSYALRGGSYLFTPATGANQLAVRAATGIWSNRRFQKQASFVIDDWQPLREAMQEVLSDGPKTRAEISAAILATPGLGDLKRGLSGEGADALYKPLHWWGDICFGPNRGQEATFRWLRDDPSWPGLPDEGNAGVRALQDYLHAYGPATPANLRYWFTEGLGVPRSRIGEWLAAAGQTIASVTVAGTQAYVLDTDFDDIRAASAGESLCLLPGFDPWLMGPGTADTRILAPSRRARFSQGAAPIVYGGRVAGLWKSKDGEVVVDWFDEAGAPPRDRLDAEVQALHR